MERCEENFLLTVVFLLAVAAVTAGCLFNTTNKYRLLYKQTACASERYVTATSGNLHTLVINGKKFTDLECK